MRLAIVVALATGATGAQTFGVSLKGQGFYCGHESTIFTRACTADEAPCELRAACLSVQLAACLPVLTVRKWS